MTDFLDLAINQVNRSVGAFCHYLTPNDASTNSHQAGFFAPKEAFGLLFPGADPSVRDNLKKYVKIHWHDGSDTDSCITYYHKAKNELRITRFGRGFPFLKPDDVGSLIVMSKMVEDEYCVTILESDDDIDAFFSHFNLPMEQVNVVIDKHAIVSPDLRLKQLMEEILLRTESFPDTRDLSSFASSIFNETYGITDRDIVASPDTFLTKWLDTETELFYQFEEKFYRPIYTSPFESLKAISDFANSFLNRRKSRVGKSLEHHLANVFTTAQLRFVEQAVTEGNKKPDFLFPGIEEYHNFEFPADDLTFLGAKTTCKDRWRQVLTEANRIDCKYLFTLQPSISANQLQEMKDERLTLVVPESNLSTFDKRYRNDLLSLKQFVGIVRERQDRHFPAVAVL
ncbi:MAG: type II restriction endonuclease [Bacteroidales bacterium]|nr:type II restriction endonuclease [Bacteroidales bacterium]